MKQSKIVAEQIISLKSTTFLQESIFYFNQLDFPCFFTAYCKIFIDNFPLHLYNARFLSPIAQSVERRTVNPQVAGSSPARGAKGSLAQSVEQRTFNPLVERSNRSRPTKF